MPYEEFKPMTPQDAAAWLKLEQFGYSVETLMRWRRDGLFPRRRIGEKPYFLLEDLVAFVKILRHEQADKNNQRQKGLSPRTLARRKRAAKDAQLRTLHNYDNDTSEKRTRGIIASIP